MIYIAINAVPILAAAMAGLAFGALWYRRHMTPQVIATAFMAEAWLAAILAGALILAPPKGGIWTMTIGSAVVIWAGFVAPALVTSYRLRRLSWRTVATDCGYWLGTMIVQAITLRLIGLTPPPA
jgi:hypothetical protein